MNACGLNATAFIIFVEHMIAGTFRKLLTEHVAKQIVIIRLILPILQILRQDIYHRPIERNDQRLSVLCDVDVRDVIIEVEVLDLNVHKTALSDACAKEEICHHPALIFGKGAFLDIGFLQ